MATPNPASTHADKPDPLIGRVLDGRYKMIEKIASGGMGAVYRAIQEPLGRTVAIKVLSIDPLDTAADSFRQRFFQEASICARLKHPNTVRIHDYGQTKDDIYYIAMEYLDGKTLREAMRPGAPMDELRAIHLMRQICSSLAEAHSMGLIHRDLKPSNIILTRHADGKEYANVVDFGLVKDIDSNLEGTTETGMIVGSPSYMSPEQILQHDLTERSDIYSLGVLLYVMLTGRKPFRQESLAAVIHRHLNAPPPSFSKINPTADISPSLEWVTMNCLSKLPEDRFASATELIRALEACTLEITGRFDRIEMSLTDGQLTLPPRIALAVSESSTNTGRRSPTEPSLARQIEPTSTRHRLPILAILMGFPFFGLLAFLMLGIIAGIGIMMMMPLRTDSPAPAAISQPNQQVTAPTPEVVAPPTPAPPPPIEEAPPHTQTPQKTETPPPTPATQPKLQPSATPRTEAAKPTPSPTNPPTPAPQPRPQTQPRTASPAPAPPTPPDPKPENTGSNDPKPDSTWDSLGDDLIDPWED